MNDYSYFMAVTYDPGPKSRTMPTGFVRAILTDARYTDSLLDALGTRLIALEEVAAARGPRRLLLAWRLAKALRASVRPFAGCSFAERRWEAVAVEWLAAQSGTAGQQS
jgi:hypothetical protein